MASGRLALGSRVRTKTKIEAETKAIAALNGKDLKGRALKVNEAQARADRPRTDGFGRDRRFCSAPRDMP